MNDFTKEELMNILYALEHLYEPPFDLPKMYLLRNKVESMIDNYDEKPETVMVRGVERDLSEFIDE